MQIVCNQCDFIIRGLDAKNDEAYIQIAWVKTLTNVKFRMGAINTTRNMTRSLSNTTKAIYAKHFYDASAPL